MWNGTLTQTNMGVGRVALQVLGPRGVTISSLPAPVAQVVECPLRGMGGHGFDPGPRHTKVFKNDTSCSLLCTQTYALELGLVEPVSG